MNYNTELIIKYRLFLNSSDITEKCMSEVVYQENFLEAFHLNEYNDNIISNQQTLLYDLFIKEDWFQVLLEKLSKKTKIDDKDIVFCYLFSYPLFHVTHELIKNFLVNNEVPNDIIKTMNEEIEKM
jgi:hypothetical protein